MMKSFFLGLLLFFLNESPSQAGPASADEVHLERVELRGTSRMTKEQLIENLRIQDHQIINEAFVANLRVKLIGMGLFRSVNLYLRKGNSPHHALLIVEVEDDPDVLEDGAYGGYVGLSLSKSTNSYLQQTPLDSYRFGLISRNFLNNLNRFGIFADFDTLGVIRRGSLGFGLPRFAAEETQFDVGIELVDPDRRYLDALGFGTKGQAVWSSDLAVGQFKMGAAMYLNQGVRYAMPSFPRVVAGPKFGYIYNTQLGGFFPSEGVRAGVFGLLSPTRSEESVSELELTGTLALHRRIYLTSENRALFVGIKGGSARGELRLEVPLFTMDRNVERGSDQAVLFVKTIAGLDRYRDVDLHGSTYALGVRYHSNGFIAEVDFRISTAPQNGDPILAPSSGDRD